MKPHKLVEIEFVGFTIFFVEEDQSLYYEISHIHHFLG